MLIADRYELDDLPLGQGGMGAVHGGHDRHLDRRVAVKFLQLPGGPEDEVTRRFVREARILAKLEHAGAPILYDFGMFEGRLFQVMQFIDGVTVASAAEFKPALERAVKSKRPVVIDVRMENVPTPTAGHWNIMDIYSPGKKVHHVSTGGAVHAD